VVVKGSWPSSQTRRYDVFGHAGHRELWSTITQAKAYLYRL
jgi:hypothetical protein